MTWRRAPRAPPGEGFLLSPQLEITVVLNCLVILLAANSIPTATAVLIRLAHGDSNRVGTAAGSVPFGVPGPGAGETLLAPRARPSVLKIRPVSVQVRDGRLRRPSVIVPALAPRPTCSDRDLAHRPVMTSTSLRMLLPTTTVAITQNDGPQAIAHQSIESYRLLSLK